MVSRPMASNLSVHSNPKRRTLQELEGVLQSSREASSKRQQVLPQQQAEAPLEKESDTPIDTSAPLELDDFDCADGGFGSDDGKSDVVPSLVPDATPGLSEQFDKFRQYLNTATRDNRELKPNWRAAIELMSLMDNKGGSIELYGAVLNWHVRNLFFRPTVQEASSNDLLI